MKTPGHRSGVFTVNFEHISHLVLVLLFNFEQVIADWVIASRKVFAQSGGNKHD